MMETKIVSDTIVRWNYLTLVGGFKSELGKSVLHVTHENGIELNRSTDWYGRIEELGKGGWDVVSTDALPSYTRANLSEIHDVPHKEVAWLLRRPVELTESGEEALFQM